MPRWVVLCPRCKRAFTHTIVDPDSLDRRFPQQNAFPKPAIPQEGEILKCPHCQRSDKFRSCDLTLSQSD